jgi:hypothetical protein
VSSERCRAVVLYSQSVPEKAKAVGDLRLAIDKMDKLLAPAESLLGEQITPPNIGLMLEKLVGFAEIWSSVSLMTLCMQTEWFVLTLPINLT